MGIWFDSSKLMESSGDINIKCQFEMKVYYAYKKVITNIYGAVNGISNKYSHDESISVTERRATIRVIMMTAKELKNKLEKLQNLISYSDGIMLGDLPRFDAFKSSVFKALTKLGEQDRIKDIDSLDKEFDELARDSARVYSYTPKSSFCDRDRLWDSVDGVVENLDNLIEKMEDILDDMDD